MEGLEPRDANRHSLTLHMDAFHEVNNGVPDQQETWSTDVRSPAWFLLLHSPALVRTPVFPKPPCSVRKLNRNITVVCKTK
jgi:hypothetical protein